jgi:hypothetical protein
MENSWGSDDPDVLDTHIKTPPDTQIRKTFGMGRGQPFAPSNPPEIRGFRQSGITGSSLKKVCGFNFGVFYWVQVPNI